MTAAGVAGALVILGVLDGTFSGFRSSVGRTGLIDHRLEDRIAARRGLAVSLVLLTPSVFVAVLDVTSHPGSLPSYIRAGAAMLVVYGPYSLTVLLALVVYLRMGWRWRYLASAVILGPFTALRLPVAIVGGLAAVVVEPQLWLGISTLLAVVGVLSVEPLVDRLFYRAPGRLSWVRSSAT